MSNLLRTGTRLHLFLASSRAFYLMLALFGIGVVWIALFSLYPMAFDEEFHYGLIKIYATSWLPYGIEHTSDMAQYGAATADASYLFHYLMSFPYRVLSFLGLPDTAIIVMLRLLNVGFVMGALVLLRRVFAKVNVSPAVVNVSLALFMLVPVLSMLAAQINYDNLLLLVIAWCFYLIVTITNAVKKNGILPLTTLWLLAVAVLIGMSIKYAFLPIAAALFAWLVVLTIYASKNRVSLKQQLQTLTRQFKTIPPRSKIWLAALMISSLFFASHYVANFVSYGHPIPSCERVFTEQECTAYGPWNRNRNYAASRSDSFMPLSYPQYMAYEWLPGMTQRLTFAVAGKTNGFQTKLPLPALVYSFIVLSVIGTACLAIEAARRRVGWLTWFTLLLTFTYVGVLSFQLYGDYVATARPVAINGRYLLPLLPFLAVVMIQAVRSVAVRVTSQVLAFATVAVYAFLVFSGGGALTYILLSESHWYWGSVGQHIHSALQAALNSLILPFRY